MAGYLVAFALGVAVLVLTAGFYDARKKRTKEEIVQADKPLLETGEFYQKIVLLINRVHDISPVRMQSISPLIISDMKMVKNSPETRTKLRLNHKTIKTQKYKVKETPRISSPDNCRSKDLYETLMERLSFLRLCHLQT
jgi:hypothetical protein